MSGEGIARQERARDDDSRDHSDRAPSAVAPRTGAGSGPALAPAREVRPASVLDLQRRAGNRAVTQLLAGVPAPARSAPARSVHLGTSLSQVRDVQRQTEHIRTSDEVQQVSSFAGISDGELVRLIGIVLDQRWVGSRDEAALVRIWGALDEDGLVRFAGDHPDLWRQCRARGADLSDLPAYRSIQDRFRRDIVALARLYLDQNERAVQTELGALGLDTEAPSPAAAARVSSLQAAAASLTHLQQAQEAARQARVGWRIGDGGEVDNDFLGRRVKFQVPFRPGEPPPLTDEPTGMPNGDIFVQPIVPFAEVQERYDAAGAAITSLTATSPALIGLIRGRSSAATAAFVDESDPAVARSRIVAPLRAVLADIATTRTNLVGALDPLDLTPLHDRLFDGSGPAGATVWSGGFRRDVAQSLVIGRNIERATARLALQQVQHLALLLAPFTSGASLMLLLGTSAAAAAFQAYRSNREAAVVSAAEGSSVAPGTELVRPGSAEFARMTAEADAIAFGLALLTLGAAGFQAWRAGAEARALRSQARAMIREAQAEGRRVVVNIGGAGAAHEPAGAINLNPQVPGTERSGIPNLVRAPGERIGELFPPGSADQIVGYRLPPSDVIDWNRVAPGAARVLRPGGQLRVSFQGASDAAETLGQALRRNGFREVTVTSDVLVEAVR